MSAAAKPVRATTAADVLRAVSERFAFPEWALEREVVLGGRRYDAVAFNLWEGFGRNRVILGFEVKVSRQDWLTELRALGTKSEALEQATDGVYIVAPTGVVQQPEVPEGWGYLEAQGAGVSRLVERLAPRRRDPAATMPRELAARFIDRLTKRGREEEERVRAEERATLRRELDARAAELAEARSDGAREELRRLREKAQRFDRLTKVLGFSEYAGELEVARLAGLLNREAQQPGWLANQVRSAAEDLDRRARLLRDALAITPTPSEGPTRE